MKKTALMFALMTLAGSAMAEGGCHADYSNCQPAAATAQTVATNAPADSQAMPPILLGDDNAAATGAGVGSVDASAPATDASAPAAKTSDGDAWIQQNQQMPRHSSR